MIERKVSELQKEYRNFFLEKLSKFGVKSPADLSKEKKSDFFTSIKQDWAKIELAKLKKEEVIQNENGYIKILDYSKLKLYINN